MYDPTNPAPVEVDRGSMHRRKPPRRRARRGGGLAALLHQWTRGGHLTRIHGNDAKVLLCLVAWADFETTVAICGRQAIAEATGLHIRTVRRSLDQLAAAGLVEPVEATHRNATRRHRLRCPEERRDGAPVRHRGRAEPGGRDGAPVSL
jgi:hypothetical protein